jgi:hypothetical protein
METLSDQFERAVSNVTVSGPKLAKAIAAHTEVRLLLESDPELRDWGIDTILIGSYARQTARYPGKDVDVFLRFTALSVRHDPSKVYSGVERVLVAHYGDKEFGGRVTRQARSLKVDFPDTEDPHSDESFSIDAVPAVPWSEHWGIPNRDRDEWAKEEKRWILTDPAQFAAETNTLATANWSPTVGGSNAYRATIRLLRQIRHVHLGENRPGGLFTEIAAYYAWRDREVVGDSWAELVAASLSQVAVRFGIAESAGLIDPVLGTRMKPELDRAQWLEAASVFEELARKAHLALQSERCASAKIWREILGDNDRGPVLPLPDGCDAGGFPLTSIAPVEAVGSNQPRGFAGPGHLTSQ